MTVYVDDVRHPFGRMIMCHLWADTLEEVLIFVDQIAVDRKWLQQPPKASWIHFDISLGKKAEALKLGAILTDRYGPLEHLARGDVASGDLERVARGRARIAQIAKARAVAA